MTLPSNDTPLYNHPLPKIEQWLKDLGCSQDRENLNHWQVSRPTWKANLSLEVEEINVRYLNASIQGEDVQRSFKYSLSRADIEAAIFDGP